jgi:hypothetical protein
MSTDLPHTISPCDGSSSPGSPSHGVKQRDQPIPQLIEPTESAELKVPKESRRFRQSPFVNQDNNITMVTPYEAKKGTLLTRDLGMVLQVLEAWILDLDTSGTLFSHRERDMIKNLQLVVKILSDWHLSVEAGEPFWKARR